MKDDLNEAERMLKGYAEKMQDQGHVLKRQENQATDEISPDILDPGCSVQRNFYLDCVTSFYQDLKADSPTTPTFRQRKNTDLEFFIPPLKDAKIRQHN